MDGPVFCRLVPGIAGSPECKRTETQSGGFLGREPGHSSEFILFFVLSRLTLSANTTIGEDWLRGYCEQVTFDVSVLHVGRFRRFTHFRRSRGITLGSRLIRALVFAIFVEDRSTVILTKNGSL